MRIIEPQVELWEQTNPIAHVARCARVCYGNAISKGEEADKRLYESLKKSGHLSMFRHESVYAIIPYNNSNLIRVNALLSNPYVQYDSDGTNIYVATNRNFIIDYEEIASIYMGSISLIKRYQVTPKKFNSIELGHNLMRYTFHITTQISTSRELNRVSPNNIAEKSTRYVDEGNGTICRPHWLPEEAADCYNKKRYLPDKYENECYGAATYLYNCWHGFTFYKELLDRGFKREDARGILPLDTATEVVYTYSVDEWRHIIELRSNKRAHPNCQIIANMIKSKLEEYGYKM